MKKALFVILVFLPVLLTSCLPKQTMVLPTPKMNAKTWETAAATLAISRSTDKEGRLYEARLAEASRVLTEALLWSFCSQGIFLAPRQKEILRQRAEEAVRRAINAYELIRVFEPVWPDSGDSGSLR